MSQTTFSPFVLFTLLRRIIVSPFWFIRAAFCLPLGFLIAGCGNSVNITQPAANGSSSASPVAVALDLSSNADPRSFQARVCGTGQTCGPAQNGGLLPVGQDVAGQFTWAGTHGTASLCLPQPDTYTLEVYANSSTPFVGLNNVRTFTVPTAPSLSFNPSSLSMPLHSSQGAVVNLPSTESFPVQVTLVPSNMNVSLSSPMLTLPSGTTTSPSISVSSAGTSGSSTVTASASGFPACETPFANANLAVDVLAPGFAWAAPQPQPQTIAWGNSVSYPLNLAGQNLDSTTVSVSLATSGLPVGASSSFSGSPVTLSPGSPNGNASLTLNTTLSATKPGTSNFTVTGTSPGNTSTANLSLTVLRVPGPFTQISNWTTASSNCSNVTATVGPAFPSGVGVQFNSPITGVNSPNAAFSQGYAISSACKMGVVVFGSGNNSGVSFYNLGFPPAIGAHVAGNPINQLGTFVATYLSPDESLAVLIGPGGPGTTQAQSATLIDLISGRTCSFGAFTAPSISIQLTGNQVQITGSGILNPATCNVP